jgi:DNA topoisomerase-1
VIVESPTKAATIERFLGDEYTVASSIGHVRDLPANASEIPARYKGQPWARYGINLDENFEPLYIISERAKPVVAELRRHLQNASELLLASDEDREGEAIAWHLVEVLKPEIPVRRLVFHEITQTAIEQALANPRDIDMARVQAQETRRVLDRLVGFGISAVLRRIQHGLSAGRVQSPALRLIVDRERSRMKFKHALYWDLEAVLESAAHPETPFKASLKQLAAKPLAEGRDFDATTGALAPNRAVQHLLEADANRISSALANAAFVVASVEKTPRTQRPRPPFITSTLQIAGSSQLRFNASRTMRAAQTLYQNGYITYTRTDSTTLSSQALTATRTEIQKQYGEENLSAQARTYRSRASAQEAHEAIRPAGETFRHPDAVAADVDADAARLYKLIWQRTLASQMRDAQLEKTTVAIEATAGTDGLATFEAEGDIVTFPGHLLVWQESGSTDTDQNLLPPLAEDEQLQPKALEPLKHETRPPNRWTEASLIAELEKLGIGRPSTYATILERIQDVYVERKGTSLIPKWVGFSVIQLLDQHFSGLTNPAFTARMEQDLDRIARQELDPIPWLRDFWFGAD